MRIAVIGSGNVGGTLGRRWATLGHDVVFGVRDPKRGAAAVKGGAGEGALPDRARVATHAQAVRGDDGWRADVVLVATPWPAVASALSELGPGALDGVVLLDATNPLGPGLRLESGPDGASGAEQVQALAPTAWVVKAFNTTGFDNMRDPVYEGRASVMFYAGDDAAARQVATSWRPTSASTPSMRVPSRARASSSTWRCSGSRSPWVSAGRRVMGGASRFG